MFQLCFYKNHLRLCETLTGREGKRRVFLVADTDCYRHHCRSVFHTYTYNSCASKFKFALVWETFALLLYLFFTVQELSRAHHITSMWASVYACVKRDPVKDLCECLCLLSPAKIISWMFFYIFFFMPKNRWTAFWLCVCLCALQTLHTLCTHSVSIPFHFAHLLTLLPFSFKFSSLSIFSLVNFFVKSTFLHRISWTLI